MNDELHAALREAGVSPAKASAAANATPSAAQCAAEIESAGRRKRDEDGRDGARWFRNLLIFLCVSVFLISLGTAYGIGRIDGRSEGRAQRGEFEKQSRAAAPSVRAE